MHGPVVPNNFEVMILKKRVVITGLGVVTPIGNDVETFWNNLIAGKSGIDTIKAFDTSALKTKIAGEVKNFDYTQYVDKKEGRKMDRVAHFAVAVARQAVADAGIDVAQENPARLGVCVGTGIGGIITFLEQSLKYGERGPGRISPFFIPKCIINMAAGHISIKYGFKGPNVALVTACATGAHSIGEGVRLIQHGDADIMVCVGCEGAGILVLEEYEHAVARGAKIYAEVAGYGLSGDAYHITAPAEGGEGGARAMAAALKDAGLTPADVDYINAHGTSTGLGDMGELAAVKNMFAGTNACMSSTKSMTGHLLGAAGAVEAIFCVMAIRNGIVPPTINLTDPVDEVGDFDLVPNVAKKRKVDVALSNSFGFGGTNASLVMKKAS